MRACRPWLARSCIFFTSAASWERSRLAWRSICHCISAWAGRRSAAKSGRERPAPRLKPDYRRLPMPRIAGAPARSRGGHAAYNGRALPLFRFNSMAIATDRNAAVMNILRFSDLCAQGKAQGQRVFIRADLNVPLNDAGEITEDTRVRASVPAIEMALKAGAAVMVTSHLGRPTEGEFKPADSLAPVARRLGELLGREVPLVADWVDGVQVAPGQVVLLENCRVNVGEKKNKEELARKLAALCDIFVHDAFGTAHRAEGTTELQSPCNLVCRLLLEKKNAMDQHGDVARHQHVEKTIDPPH